MISASTSPSTNPPLKPSEIINMRLEKLKNRAWDVEPGMTLMEELSRNTKEFTSAALIFARTASALHLSINKILLRLVYYSAPYCRLGGKIAFDYFMSLDLRLKWAIIIIIASAIVARKIWRHRYISRTLDYINLIHYRVSKFLTFIGPYALVLVFGYFPLKWWQRNSSRFNLIYTNFLLLIMILCSLKIVIDYNYAAASIHDPAAAAAGAPAAMIIKSSPTDMIGGGGYEVPRSSSPVLVEKLRLLVTPRPIEARPLLSCDAKYRASNAVVVCLSCWLGLVVYQLLMIPIHILMMFVSRAPAFNLWLSLYGGVVRNSSTADYSQKGSNLALTFIDLFDEIVLTIIFIGILARDNTLARYSRNLSALSVDSVLTKLTGFSVQTIPGARQRIEDDDRWQHLGQASHLIHFLPYGDTLQGLLSNWSTVQSIIVHFAPILLLTLPSFCVRFICLAYAGFYPLAFASRSAVTGSAMKSNYWLTYFAVVFGAILFSHTCALPQMRSSRIKMLVIMLAQYCIDSPRHLVTLAVKMTTTDDGATRDDDAGISRFGRLSSVMNSAPPSPMSLDRDDLLR